MQYFRYIRPLKLYWMMWKRVRRDLIHATTTSFPKEPAERTQFQRAPTHCCGLCSIPIKLPLPQAIVLLLFNSHRQQCLRRSPVLLS